MSDGQRVFRKVECPTSHQRPPPSLPNLAADASEIKTANKRTYILQLWLIYSAPTSPRWNVSYRRPSINCDKRANSGSAGKVSQTIISQSQIIAAVKCFFHNFLISKSSGRTQAKQAAASPHPFPLASQPHPPRLCHPAVQLCFIPLVWLYSAGSRLMLLFPTDPTALRNSDSVTRARTRCPRQKRAPVDADCRAMSSLSPVPSQCNSN